MKPKYRPRVGDVRWFVQWCDKLAFDSCGDVDRDNCRERTRMFTSREHAEKFAREVWPQTVDKFGIVEFWEAEFTAYDDGDGPYLGHWEPTSDRDEVYEGPDE